MAQYAPGFTGDRGSLYKKVVLAPPSYEHAHTSMGLDQVQAEAALLPLTKHTFAFFTTGSPTEGWRVLSHPP